MEVEDIARELLNLIKQHINDLAIFFWARYVQKLAA